MVATAVIADPFLSDQFNLDLGGNYHSCAEEVTLFLGCRGCRRHHGVDVHLQFGHLGLILLNGVLSLLYAELLPLACPGSRLMIILRSCRLRRIGYSGKEFSIAVKYLPVFIAERYTTVGFFDVLIGRFGLTDYFFQFLHLPEKLLGALEMRIEPGFRQSLLRPLVEWREALRAETAVIERPAMRTRYALQIVAAFGAEA